MGNQKGLILVANLSGKRRVRDYEALRYITTKWNVAVLPIVVYNIIHKHVHTNM